MSVSAEFIEFFTVGISIKQTNSLLLVISSNFATHRLARKRLPRPGVAVEVDEVRSDGKKLEAGEKKHGRTLRTRRPTPRAVPYRPLAARVLEP